MDYLSALGNMKTDELDTERTRLIEYACSVAYETAPTAHQNYVAACVVACSRERLRRGENTPTLTDESEA
jgi:hypothetical protein